ncbi:ATP-binding protein [Hydrogenophaga sp. PAMC20947]|uniref:ATP-binding protein n=1 Tax=Hydrogenophaga sp. PAMC20947 TaxID=2565558 RepID=UPI00109DE326|nr:ATP-binding protein [Hydrogenophaga sp. PAMC20947]QCB48306.1 HAMP domain-containing protein [Hydrogenophaga sp. PAMC20947]
MFGLNRLRHSLRGRLLGVLLLAIVLAAAVQAAVVYRQARAEADSIFDYHMEQMAQALRAGVAVSGLPVLSDERHGGRPVDFVVQVWSMEGLQVYRSSDRVGLPQRAVLGFSEADLSGRPFRVFALQTPFQVIQIAQDMGPRRAMARSLALRTVMPIVWMAPLLMLVAWWAVGASLKPVARVREQVAARAADDLATVTEEGLPDEIKPLVRELNLLFGRVGQAFEAQQHFVADAAHELRSPLAALRLQVQGLQRARDDATRQVAVDRLLAGIDRATRLVEQLLVLARHQAGSVAPGGLVPVSLDALARETVAEMAPKAALRAIDLGVEAAQALQVQGQAEALRILLRNLVDNAIKYTPAGGQVDVSVFAENGDAVLVVEDSGPGIEENDRARVLDRFYRVPGEVAPGSGLGLAIVSAIAQWHGARMSLGRSEAHGGLRVAVRWAKGSPTKAL